PAEPVGRAGTAGARAPGRRARRETGPPPLGWGRVPPPSASRLPAKGAPECADLAPSLQRPPRSVGCRAAGKPEPMRAVVQRVSSARVMVAGDTVGAIGPGLLVLVGIAAADDEPTAIRLAGKIANLRIFENEAGKFDRSLLDGGAALVVSQ